MILRLYSYASIERIMTLLPQKMASIVLPWALVKFDVGLSAFGNAVLTSDGVYCGLAWTLHRH